MQCWDKNECYREKEECEYIMNERVQEKRPKGVRVFERGKGKMNLRGMDNRDV